MGSSISDDRTVRAFGLEFPNPIGLAAGYDKDGVGLQGLACLGFGHIELGSVTPLPQRGNPKPRVFRLIEDRALINRMGFPNMGGDALLQRLRQGKPTNVIVGVNIGKGFQTPLETAVEDYLGLLREFYFEADYLAINISSPNTLGLRRLQSRKYLETLLEELVSERNILREQSRKDLPLLVKLAPDLSREELDDAIDVLLSKKLDGVIATNTTLARPFLRSKLNVERGGLSGFPLRQRAMDVVAHIHRITSGSIPIIGVGGIMCPEDARAMLDSGASLIQLYTGLIYQGPGLVERILKSLASEY